jgi:hypothetical protein
MSLTFTDPAPTLEDIWRLFRETDRKMQETDRRLKETESLIKEQSTQLSAQLKEYSAQLKESERNWEKRSKELDKKIGRLSNRLGEFVEEMVKPAAVKLFQERGIDVHVVSQRVQAKNPHLNLAMEIDLLVINGDSCILIETKSNVSIDDVNEHLERMEKFKPLFPKYETSNVYGAVAGMVIPEDVAKYAYRKGFFVIGQTGETVAILNDLDFKPTAW